VAPSEIYRSVTVGSVEVRGRDPCAIRLEKRRKGKNEVRRPLIEPLPPQISDPRWVSLIAHDQIAPRILQATAGLGKQWADVGERRQTVHDASQFHIPELRVI
jgi:hypothetical protein